MKRLLLSLILAICIISVAVPAHAVEGTVSLANARLSLVNGTAFVDFSSANTLTPYLGWKLTLMDSAGKKAIGYIKAAGGQEATTGSVALANTKLSLVNGTAFVDLTGVDVAQYADGRHRIKVTDSAGKSAYGWLKAAGTGETLGASRITLDFDVNWAAGTGATIIDADSFSTASSAQFIRRNDQLTVGTLYRGAFAGSSTATGVELRSSSGGITYSNLNSSGYGNAPTTDVLILHFSTSGQTDATLLTLSQVLTPSATGATIVSGMNGTTYNWESIEAGFSYNDASGYTYTVYGEQYDSELVTNGDFALESDWTLGANTVIGGGVATATTQDGTVALQAIPVTDSLNKIVFTITRTAGTIIPKWGISRDISGTISAGNTYTLYSNHLTTDDDTIRFYGSGFSGTLDNVSIKQVLTPSATGVTITSTPNGSTYNWASIEASFNFNDASGYSYKIIPAIKGIGMGMGIISGF